MENRIFLEQIRDDIQLLKENLAWDSNISKDEYAFNYWILSNIYNLDEEECNGNITEYNDKGIDCFVHFEEDKELYIIQNKYYSESTPLTSKEISDFLTRPIAKLEEGNYTRSAELQKIYNKVKEDNSYKIFLHFYVTNNNVNDDALSVINNFNNDEIIAKLFRLEDIKSKYYGKAFKENQVLRTTLGVRNKATYLAIRPEEYCLPNMSEAYYVMAKVIDVFSLFKDAENKDYPLFEENIREYLGGTSGINKAIISTLKDENQRKNFFYYNNGITMICKSAKADAKHVDIINPQIVNGCQTVNSISEALKNDSNLDENFRDVYVMVKILVLEKNDTGFYRDIVKYTNSQNSINDKVFGATLQPFFTIQEKIRNYGFLLTVKQSDKFQFKQKYGDKKELGTLLNVAKSNTPDDFLEYKNVQSLQITLETLIQIIGAFVKDAHLAYTKKSLLLKPTNKEYYQEFSSKIGDYFTAESMAKLVIIYKRAELDKKNSEDKKTPAPYYLFNFLGFYLEQNDIDKQEFLKRISVEDIKVIYDKFKNLSNKYHSAFKEKHGLEYNHMIKHKIDYDIMQSQLSKHFNSMKEYNADEYEKLMNVFKKMKD